MEDAIDSTIQPKRTLAGNFSDTLRAAILAGDLRPGARLRIQDLTKTYALSMSTVREALLRLVADGLVVIEEQRGFAVAPVSRAQLIDLLGMRLLLEEQGLRLAIEHGGDKWEAMIVASFHSLRKASEASRDGQNVDCRWEAAHSKFHYALIASCGSPLLLQIRDTIFNQGERYRRIYRRDVPRRRDHLAEHQALMEAVLDGDAERAVMLIRGHLQATVKTLLDSGVLGNTEPVVPDGGSVSRQLPALQGSEDV